MALTAKQRRAALEKGLNINLSPQESKYTKPNPNAAHNLFTPSPDLNRARSLPADGRPHGTADGRPEVLPADRLSVAPQDEGKTIPLAPLQWAILEALQEAERQQKVVSYRKLARAANASIRGVRDALAVIEKEGGIHSKVTIRTSDEQGMRIELNPLVPFRKATLKETKGIIKRGNYYRQTVNRESSVLPAYGLRLSVII